MYGTVQYSRHLVKQDAWAQSFLPTAREGNVFRSVCQSFCLRREAGSDYSLGSVSRGYAQPPGSDI